MRVNCMLLTVLQEVRRERKCGLSLFVFTQEPTRLGDGPADFPSNTSFQQAGVQKSQVSLARWLYRRVPLKLPLKHRRLPVARFLPRG